MLRLTLFGGFSVRADDGVEIDIELAKQRALLAYLAVNVTRSIDRGQLAALFWGRQEDARARHSLTQALSALASRSDTLADALERSKGSVRLRDGAVESDFARVRAGAVSSEPTAMAEAVVVFQTDMLGEFSFNEPGFDEWAMVTREACQQAVMRAGLNYLALEPDQRDAQRSIEVAQKLLRIDPFYEPAHRALIREHLAAGDVGAAIKQADTCRTLLRDELGVDPAPETQRVIEGIKSSRSGNADATSNEGEASSERPSIVVLPLENLTGDPGLGHLCQGLSDDVTTELARYRSFFVISRESAFQSPVGPEELGVICRRLGVRYALAGSLKPYRDRLRINLRLIEGTSGRTIWSERYDVGEEQLLNVSDDAIEHLVSRLSVSIEDDALSSARRRAPADWKAYDHLLQGLRFHHQSWYGANTLRGAVKHFKRAVELDPDFARAHAYLACAISAPWYKDRELPSLDRCLHHAERAVQLDPFEAEAQRIMGGVHLTRGDHDLADHHFRQALRVHPGNAHVLAHAARYHAHVGSNDEAVALVNHARQLNPLHPAWYWQHLGIAAFGQDDFESAARMFSRLPAPVFYDRLYLASAKAHLGDRAVAERHLQFVLEEKPDLDSANVARFLPYSRAEDRDKVVQGLKMAGLH